MKIAIEIFASIWRRGTTQKSTVYLAIEVLSWLAMFSLWSMGHKEAAAVIAYVVCFPSVILANIADARERRANEEADLIAGIAGIDLHDGGVR